MAIHKFSRYIGTYTYSDYNDTNIIHLDTMREPLIEPSKEDLLIEFQEGDRLDIISRRLYGTEKLEWIILDANPQYASGLDVKVGDVVRCPLPPKVSEVIE